MQFRDIENALVEYFLEEKYLLPLSWLIDNLMREATNGEWRYSSDGINFLREVKSTHHFRGVGMDILLPDSHPEPASVQFEVSKSDKKLLKAKIKYGSCSSKKPEYQSRQHMKLEKKFLADENYEFDWLRVFTFEKQHWSVSVPQLGIGLKECL